MNKSYSCYSIAILENVGNLSISYWKWKKLLKLLYLLAHDGAEAEMDDWERLCRSLNAVSS